MKIGLQLASHVVDVQTNRQTNKVKVKPFVYFRPSFGGRTNN